MSTTPAVSRGSVTGGAMGVAASGGGEGTASGGTASLDGAWSGAGGTDISAPFGSVKGIPAVSAGEVAVAELGWVAVAELGGVAVVEFGGVAVAELGGVAAVELGGVAVAVGAAVTAPDRDSPAPGPATSMIAAIPSKASRLCAGTLLPARRPM
ncbi:MAG TPA: hypothetical protein VFH68_26050 [Polyangia bacterium]|nr:hypothetical protein [Polyangia bacterium]